MGKKKQATKEDLLDLLAQGVVELKFTKKNGEVRDMICTRAPKYIPEEHTPKGEVQVSETSDNIRVYDLQKNAWRSFNFSTVIL